MHSSKREDVWSSAWGECQCRAEVGLQQLQAHRKPRHGSVISGLYTGHSESGLLSPMLSPPRAGRPAPCACIWPWRCRHSRVSRKARWLPEAHVHVHVHVQGDPRARMRARALWRGLAVRSSGGWPMQAKCRGRAGSKWRSTKQMGKWQLVMIRELKGGSFLKGL